jgi:hypothetical protein
MIALLFSVYDALLSSSIVDFYSRIDLIRMWLEIVQQPLRARMCGFGEKDRRPVDPPPVVQLHVLNAKGEPDTE